MVITLKDHLNFSLDEAGAKKWYSKIKGAHAAGCTFKVADKVPYQVELSQTEIDTEKVVIVTRKLIYARWQEVLVGLFKAWVEKESLPIIDKNSIEKFRSTFFPDDFVKIIAALSKLQQGSTPRDLGQSEFPTAALLALCGWRRLNKEQSEGYIVECASCLKRYDSQNLALPDTVEGQFEFDLLDFHSSHCFYSSRLSSKSPLFYTISKFLLVLSKQDP